MHTLFSSLYATSSVTRLLKTIDPAGVLLWLLVYFDKNVFEQDVILVIWLGFRGRQFSRSVLTTSHKSTRKLLGDDLMNPLYIILQMQESESSSSESLTSLHGKRMEH